jgi:hypothetical protein
MKGRRGICGGNCRMCLSLPGLPFPIPCWRARMRSLDGLGGGRLEAAVSVFG